MFDWITGTSTGGILCLALAVGMTPLQCQSLYFKLKDNVFVGKRPYAVEPMEEFLKKEFTETLMMTDLPEKPFIAVTGTLADRYSLKKPCIFKFLKLFIFLKISSRPSLFPKLYVSYGYFGSKRRSFIFHVADQET